MTYLYIYLVGLVGLGLWLAWVLYLDKRDSRTLPTPREAFEVGFALLVWPVSAIYLAIVIGVTAWDRRGY